MTVYAKCYFCFVKLSNQNLTYCSILAEVKVIVGSFTTFTITSIEFISFGVFYFRGVVKQIDLARCKRKTISNFAATTQQILRVLKSIKIRVFKSLSDDHCQRVAHSLNGVDTHGVRV